MTFCCMGTPPPRRVGLVSSAVLGMLIFVVCEAMLFGGLISAFLIVKTQSIGMWPPPGQPRLPVERTALNTVALLLSAVALFSANRAFARERSRARNPLLLAIALGAAFVLAQGMEWVALIGEGLTLTSSTHGSFFYLLVGAHGVHVVGALALMISVWLRLVREELRPSTFHASQVLWYFVVGLWPLLYVQVYL